MLRLKQYASLGAHLLSDALKLSRSPYKLIFQATSKCNCRCGHCGIWKSEGLGEMTIDEIRAFAESYPRFKWIDVTGGEIFLREDVTEIFSALIGINKDLALLHFPTNGSMPDEVGRTAAAIKARFGGKLVITVSLDAPPALHDLERGRPGLFDNACETINLLKKQKGVGVYAGFTLTNRNCDLFEELLSETIRRIPGFSSGDFHFNLFHSSAHYYGNTNTTPPDAKATAARFARLSSKRNLGLGPLELVQKRYSEGVASYLDTGRPPIPCAALSATCFISPTGTVYPCTIHDRPAGSLRECGYDLGTLFQSQATAQILNEIQKGECPGCWTPCEAFPAIIRRLAFPLSPKSR